MVGIRVEGGSGGGARPPGMGAEGQLGAAIGGDPFTGMSLAQLSAMQAGSVPFSSAVQAQMDAHAAQNMAAVRAASGAAPAMGARGAQDARAVAGLSEVNKAAAGTSRSLEKLTRAADSAANALGNLARPAGGGVGGGGISGGGGRGSEGGGGGHGWGRPHIPFIGGLGFNAAAALAIGGFDLGMAGHLVGDVALAPQKIGNMMSGVIGSATPAYNLLQFSTGFSRAIGARGNPLEGRLYSPYHAPAWMQALGLGPTQAAGLAQNFGILGGSVGAEQGIMQALGGLSYMPGLSGVGPQAQTVIGTAARYGAIAPTSAGIQGYGMQLSQLMEDAVAKGMDRAAVLQSINSGITFVARQGALSVDSGQVGRFMFRFAGLPGGRTGEAGLTAMQGLAGAMGTVGQNPLRTMMAATAAEHAQTPAQLAHLLGHALPTSAEGQRMVQNYFQAVHSGDNLAAALYLQALTAGDPGAQARILSQSSFFQGLPSYWVPLAGGATTGMGPSRFLAWQTNQNAGAPSGAVTVNQPFLGSVSSQGKAMMYDSSITDSEYTKRLLRMGVSPAYVSTVIAAAKKNNVNPVFMGAVMMQESSGGWNAAAQGNVMQITPNPNQPAPPMSPEASINTGAAMLSADIAKGGGLHRVLQRYNGPAMDAVNPSYYPNVVAWMGGAGNLQGNVPSGSMASMADAMNVAITASVTSLNEMNVIVPVANTALGKLAQSALAAASALGSAAKAAAHTSQTGPWVIGAP